jgi:antirestriction protein ArdC
MTIMAPFARMRAASFFRERAMRDIYREVTEQIIVELKAGARPWIQPWSQTPGLNISANAVSGRPYSGVNTLLLWTARRHNWPQPRFLTFKQALEAGGHVRKGEHGQHVVFVKDLVRRSANEDEEPGTIRMLKNYTVFNIAQCDELPDKLTAPPKAPNPDQRDVLIDEFIAATGAKIHESDVEDQASYCGDTLDLIHMPAFKFFHGRVEYCATLFHELVHWTGHPSRLDRQLGARFGLRSKAAEELIAELGAAFLCAEFSIDGFIPHAAYIQNYLELLEHDSKAIFTAASKAQAAVDFLRQQILAEPATAALVAAE